MAKNTVPSRLPLQGILLLATTIVLIGGAAISHQWRAARQEVRDWLADPPAPPASFVWSAPLEIRQGQEADLDALTDDLVAARYDHVDAVDPQGTSAGAGQFAVDHGTLTVFTRSLAGPDYTLDEGTASLTIEDGTVVDAGPDGVLRLRPTLLATLGDPSARRAPVELDQTGPWVEPALLAIEDARFRQHAGIDPRGVARALWNNLTRPDQGLQGGSTLTQQLAKNLFLTSDRTLARKAKEVLYATALESELDKNAILELYLGEIYFGQAGGQPLYGVKSASRAFFGVSPANLELHEAALVAGVIAAPNHYSPFRHPDTAFERRNEVLDRMVETGAIGATQAERAQAEPLDLAGVAPSRVRLAPYAVDAVLERAETLLGNRDIRAGLHIHTTLDPLLQRSAESAVQEGLIHLEETYDDTEGAQAALVALNVHDARVLALVGGRSYPESPFNRVTDAHRQVGSTVKPLTLLAAFDDEAVTPAQVLVDEEILRYGSKGEPWTPHNHDGDFVGEITVRRAVELSRNIPAVLLSEEVGLRRLRSHLHRAGLPAAHRWPSTALGGFEATPLELVSAYTALPAGGTWREPFLVTAITTRDGEHLELPEPASRRLTDRQAAAQTVRILEGVTAAGTGARSRRHGLDWQDRVAGKTGTTDDYRDAWFVGFSRDVSAAVWVGRDEGGIGLTGSKAALPTWSRFLAASGRTDAPFPIPGGLVAAEVCRETGLLAREDCPSSATDLFRPDTQPSRTCFEHAPARTRWLRSLFSRRHAPADSEDEHLFDALAIEEAPEDTGASAP